MPLHQEQQQTDASTQFRGYYLLIIKIKNTSFKGTILFLDEEIRYNTNELDSGVYHLAAVDLRKLSEVETKLAECLLEFNVPTLFLFECVLVYMPIQFSHALLQFIADKFSTTFCINYEQVL